MFARAAAVAATAALPAAAAPAQQARNMATLKEISVRLKSISNIAKITKSMKMIASTKVTRAQRTMEQARVFGEAATAILKYVEVEPKKDNVVVVTVSSDRGLCGGIHSSVSKATKRFLAANPSASSAILGQKAKSQVQREYRDNIFLSFDGVTKNAPTWFEAALIGDAILSAKPEYESASIIYNRFKSVIAFETESLSIPSVKSLASAPKLAAYEYDDDLLKNFEEFTIANTLYWAIAEGYASEMSAKRTAMENATKNAGEMIQKLTLTYNRSRQATITNELIDIITGASAM
ncbi:atp3 gamma subunit of the F1 sector of mitochondrial F1F0 ATP synthase [Polyrhizophydium stewartii]|uniref:ATP synthase subunit gamma n=1 Tax=Polyrhizophydium stewartii TaxID=2732419 RepID=A0ABR4MYG9_9FUNG|nr:atp3 gamma subunit of the F1 sector of mitochondrial F1F0 ATP synthase [Polyrhizophydium stewartii]